VASAPITKHDLLLLLREAYGHRVDIVPDDVLRIDRSLDGNAFARATGYVAPTWSRLVTEMRDFG
jgi:dTDP-4-dehydrorhamnose reductase